MPVMESTPGLHGKAAALNRGQQAAMGPVGSIEHCYAEPPAARHVSLGFQVLMTFAVTSVVLLFLRSTNYLAVDGALRALEVYNQGRPFLHPNNHLLYAINVYGWSTLLGWLGIHPKDSFEFMSIAQAMNALAAGGFLAILYGLSYKLTGRTAVASLTVIGYGCSRAFLAHATNSAEPLVGLFYSGLAVLLAAYAAARSKPWAGAAAGFTLAMGMAAYQSMILIGPALLFLVWRWPSGSRRLSSVLSLCAGVGLGIGIIFGAAYYWDGARSADQLVHRFLQIPGGQQYGGLHFVKAGATLPGLAYALFPCLPPECDGFRCLFAIEYHSWIPIAAAAIVIAGIWIVAMLYLGFKLWHFMAEIEKAVTISCLVALIFTGMPLLSWLPTYDKLWLQPLACLFFVIGVIVNVATRSSDARMVGLRYLISACGFTLALVIVLNLVRQLRQKSEPTPFLLETQQVAAMVGPEDLLVGDWNGVFLLYQAFWGARGNSFNVPTKTLLIGARSINELDDAVFRTERRGGRVFFLGLLDVPVREWAQEFEGQPIPHAALEEYRRSTQVVTSFSVHHRVITLKRLVSEPVL
jgi:hypothetical protein